LILDAHRHEHREHRILPDHPTLQRFEPLALAVDAGPDPEGQDEQLEDSRVRRLLRRLQEQEGALPGRRLGPDWRSRSRLPGAVYSGP
jgi:hypothetical protein